MSRVYDSWERLVAAVLEREKLRHLALCESFSSSISADFRSRFSFDEDETTASTISSNTITPGVTSIPVPYAEFEQVKKATRNFRSYSDLGEGAFGHFSKGWIDEHTLTASKPGFGTAVAVKMYNTGLEGIKECFKEINYLSRFRHPNIVKLIGYSYEDIMVLVFEFCSKGSLDSHLFRGSHETLPWVTRIKLAVHVARGLAFLHDNEKPIIHQSLNTADILLDGEFNAKLCNFSLAKDGPTGGMTHVLTEAVGTYGYAAPEYIAIELLTGRRSIDSNSPIDEYNLVDWEKPYLRRERKLVRIMDPKLVGRFPHKAAHTVATIALQCLSQIPEPRPHMAEVLFALEKL